MNELVSTARSGVSIDNARSAHIKCKQDFESCLHCCCELHCCYKGKNGTEWHMDSCCSFVQCGVPEGAQGTVSVPE